MEQISNISINSVPINQINEEEQNPAKCIKLFTTIMDQGDLNDQLTNEFLHQVTDLSQDPKQLYQSLQSIQNNFLCFQNL